MLALASSLDSEEGPQHNMRVLSSEERYSPQDWGGPSHRNED